MLSSGGASQPAGRGTLSSGGASQPAGGISENEKLSSAADMALAMARVEQNCIDVREGCRYCTICAKWADDKHIASDSHQKWLKGVTMGWCSPYDRRRAQAFIPSSSRTASSSNTPAQAAALIGAMAPGSSRNTEPEWRRLPTDLKDVYMFVRCSTWEVRFSLPPTIPYMEDF